MDRVGLRRSSGSRARSTRSSLRRVLAGQHPRDGVAARDGRDQEPRARIRLDVLGAEERQRALRARRRRAARSSSARRTSVPSREALGYLERSAAVTRRGPGGAQVDRGPGLRRGGVPAPDVARRRSAAAHACPRRQPRAGRGRALVDARRPPASIAHARRPATCTRRGLRAQLTARARRRVDAGAQRDRRHRRRPADGAARVQPPPGRDRGGARPARAVERGRRAGGDAGDAARQGLPA